MTGTLPEWLARLLGRDAAGSGQGTSFELVDFWTWPAWLTLLVILGIAALVVLFYVREIGAASLPARLSLAALRLCTIGIVLLMIAGWILSLQRTDLPYVLVLFDVSGSMGVIDPIHAGKVRDAVARRLKSENLSEASRLNLAKTLLLERDSDLLTSLSKKYRVKLFFVAAGATDVSQEPDLAATIRSTTPSGESSRLGDSLRAAIESLSGSPVAAAVLFSDGITTDGKNLSETAAFCRRKSIPLFTVALGSQEPLRDVELADLLVEDIVFVDDLVTFDARVTATGLKGRRVEVVLRDAKTAAELARKSLDLANDAHSETIRLTHRPTSVGDFEFVVEAEPLADEASRANNSLRRAVSVRRQKVRVLLAQSDPSYEFRFLKHLLERQPTFDLKVVLQDADVEFTRIDKAALDTFPFSPEALSAFDVVILGDVNPSLLSPGALTGLRSLVKEQAGGLVFIAGPRFNPIAFRDTPLEELLPIELDDARRPDADQPLDRPFTVIPSDLGVSAPALVLDDSPAENIRVWKQLPPIYWRLEAPRVKRGARVLAESATERTADGRKLPLIVAQYVGSGEVLFHAFDASYLWRGANEDRHFGRYWLQTLRGLARAKLLGADRRVELATDRREYRRGQTVRLQVRFFADRDAPAEADGVRVVVQRQGGDDQTVTLQRSGAARGLFVATLADLPAGAYRARLTAPLVGSEPPAADFLVRPPPGEMERLQMDLAEMTAAARISGGQSYSFDTAAELADDLPAGRQVPTAQLPAIPLWNRWPVPLVLLTLLIAEWLLRKRVGML
jgi:uncharacterized membrane protein